jgi:hypothetical protein
VPLAFERTLGACPPRKRRSGQLSKRHAGWRGRKRPPTCRQDQSCEGHDPKSAAGWAIIRPGCAARAAGLSKVAPDEVPQRNGPERGAGLYGRPASTGEPAGKVGRSGECQHRHDRAGHAFGRRPVGVGTRKLGRFHVPGDVHPVSAAGVGNLTRGAWATCRLIRSGKCLGRRCGQSAVPPAHGAMGHARRCSATRAFGGSG